VQVHVTVDLKHHDSFETSVVPDDDFVKKSAAHMLCSITLAQNFRMGLYVYT
jgi:hypothetical protein